MPLPVPREVPVPNTQGCGPPAFGTPPAFPSARSSGSFAPNGPFPFHMGPSAQVAHPGLFGPYPLGATIHGQTVNRPARDFSPWGRPAFNAPTPYAQAHTFQASAPQATTTPAPPKGPTPSAPAQKARSSAAPAPIAPASSPNPPHGIIGQCLMTPWQVFEPIFTLPDRKEKLEELRREVVLKRQSLDQVRRGWQDFKQSPEVQSQLLKGAQVQAQQLPLSTLPPGTLQGLEDFNRSFHSKSKFYQQQDQSLNADIEKLEREIALYLRAEKERLWTEGQLPGRKDQGDEHTPTLYNQEPC
ncbi:hypothetical protein HD806DRAFT_280518 [Xylariaceae sp. AK1471]|nr:hypothetical protein HD806DRAFT_280518 [Xylariaceae sp. AK1471]